MLRTALFRIRYVPPLVLLLASPVQGQTAPASLFDGPPRCGRPDVVVDVGDLSDGALDLARLADITGFAKPRPFLIQRLAELEEVRVCPGAPLPLNPGRGPSGASWLGVRLAPARAVTFFNSTYPVERNNGAVWAGRGLSMSFQAGVRLHVGPFRAALEPEIVYQENRDFLINPLDRPGLSPYAYVGHPYDIDWPQRFGDGAFSSIRAGQSYARLDAFGLSVGVSTENLWWGPARRNPILMGNTAPGFLHAFLGTSSPQDIYVGRLHVQAVWAELQESAFFDTDALNDRREFAGLVGSFSPRWLPGLHLGGARVAVIVLPHDGVPFGDFLLDPYHDVRTNVLFGPGVNDQLLSLFGRWSLPRAGFEAYVEWARGDHWQNNEDLVSEPDHSQGYTLGFQKVVAIREAHWLRLGGEITHLEKSITNRTTRGTPTFYIHEKIPQGYTHQGQLLGAWIGPGSDAQYLGAELLASWGSIGLFGERVRRDDDAYYGRWVRKYGIHGHDVELSGGASTTLVGSSFDVHLELELQRRKNRLFIGHDEPGFDVLWERNAAFVMAVTWRPDKSWSRSR